MDKKRVIVIGNSFSVDMVDIALAYNTWLSIGVNRVLNPRRSDGYVFTPDKVLIVDMSVIDDQAENIREFHPHLVMDSAIHKKAVKRLGVNNAEQFCIGDKSMEFFRMEGPYYRAGNTGMYALEYAYRATCGNAVVGLIGMDMVYPPEGPSHFWCDGITPKCRPFFKRSLKWLEKFKGRLAGEFRVVNLSPYHKHSPLSGVLDYIPFEDFFVKEVR